MDTMNDILYKSALETYDFAEKNKKHVVNLISMFLPKETKDFFINYDFNPEYYSELDLKLIEKDKKRKCKTTINKKKRTIEPRDSLTKSMNKSKIKYAIRFIPNEINYLLIFFSYITLHNIYFFILIIIGLFITNINILILALIILILNMGGIIIFSGCPVSILEQKYRNKIKYNQDFFSNILKSLYDNYNNHHTYEELIEKLIILMLFFIVKIFCICLYRYFRSV